MKLTPGKISSIVEKRINSINGDPRFINLNMHSEMQFCDIIEILTDIEQARNSEPEKQSECEHKALVSLLGSRPQQFMKYETNYCPDCGTKLK